MVERDKNLEDELNELRQEIEDFKKEKERVRAIVGRIGGAPTFNTRLFNIVFATLVAISLVISLMSRGTLRLAMLEIATALISVKLIYIMHNQARVNHFQLWILSSLEWRINEIQKTLRKLEWRFENLEKNFQREKGDEPSPP
ncbi:MAG: hypothetical protein DRQ06_03170 [Candidatus Hydrothermota bacterium]|uniref:Uncharacterized protein n=1 Tax=candidate division WOR-3 bacterium TaxID=2052148 RepID=A0A7C0XDE9_UNCW3|nr:MAG: hypothetical protein DRQ06_03170 [Candidatus Hydrothermae bacterium]RKY99523.1 MAG: hypothetical protein DRQ04_07405 [Candidatus Hydrothermae bacterium]HDM90478.1 hypothetical protein [candidate division WOR-3 bacterium]